MSVFANLTLEVEVHLEWEPGQSNPITGTELPYEYLAVRKVEATKTEVLGNPNAIELLEWSDEALDIDCLAEQALQEALAEKLPREGL